ncbi:uncharacterized protein METZ01_LOCUS196344, partial [marine metagenome]
VYINENLNTLPTRENVHMYVKCMLKISFYINDCVLSKYQD